MYKRLIIYAFFVLALCVCYFGYVGVIEKGKEDIPYSLPFSLPLWQQLVDFPEKTIKTLECISKLSPCEQTRGEADFLLGSYYYEKGQPAVALPYFERSSILATNLRNRAVFVQGCAYYEIGLYDKAVVRFTDLKNNPFWKKKATYYLAQCYLERKDISSFEEELKTLDDSTVSELLFKAATVFEDNKIKADEFFMRVYFDYSWTSFARKAGKKLQLKKIKNERLWLKRARALYKKRMYYSALISFRKIKELKAEDSVCKGVCYYKRKKYTDALRLFRNSKSAVAQYYSARIYLKQKKYKSYERHIMNAVRAENTDGYSVRAAKNYCDFLFQRDRYDDMKNVLSEILSAQLSAREREDLSFKLGWILFKEGNYKESRTYFSYIIEEGQEIKNCLKAAYWHSRSFEEEGNIAEALRGYGEINRKYRWNYYGMRSGERIEKIKTGKTEISEPYELKKILFSLNDDNSKDSGNIDLKSVMELEKLGLYDEALEELEFYHNQNPESVQIAFTRASCYSRRGDYYKAMRAFTKTVPFEVVEATLQHLGRAAKFVYPLDYFSLIDERCRKKALDPMLVAGLINQESYFVSNAKSGAGAIGLMQIMPGTGKMIARKLKDRKFKVENLFNIETNLTYGIYYFSGLMEEFDGKAEYALAGYNAGPGRARRWAIASSGDVDIFVEDIPFDETRDYVKKVTAKYRIYTELYGK